MAPSCPETFTVRQPKLVLTKSSLNRDGSDSLSDQIYRLVKIAIQNGTLHAGAKLPSTREMAEQLSVSRPTVFASIDQLSKEGYIQVRPGSGIYVAANLLFDSPDAKSDSQNSPPITLSRYAQLLQAQPVDQRGEFDEPEIAFYPWRPAFDQFPKIEWARTLGRVGRNLDNQEMDHAREPQGSGKLRKQISQLVAKYRGLECSEDQVVLTMGLNHAIDLISRLHLESHSQVLLEDPGYHIARQIIALSGAVVRPGPLDGEGMVIPNTKTKIDLLYLTPSHQFPTGVTMSLKRRLDILAWATESNTIIAEDDYDSEYQLHSKPIPALMSLDKNSQVLYAGTLNQMMFPGLSVGYLIVPPRLVETYLMAKRFGGEPLPLQLQNAISEFLEQGELERHMRRQQSIYSERRAVLTEELKRTFGKSVELNGSDAGVFILARFKKCPKDDVVMQRSQALDVGLIPTRMFYQNSKSAPFGEYILGFGNLSLEQMSFAAQSCPLNRTKVAP